MMSKSRSDASSDPAETADEQPALVAINHYSTDDIPAELRHESWSAMQWPSIASLFDSRPLEDFSTEADLVTLDQLLLQYARGTAREFERSVARARDDGIDVLGIGIQLDGGPMTGRVGARTFTVPEGALLLLDLAQQCTIVHPSGASIQIAVPRALAQTFLGSLLPLHGTVVAPARSAMLVSHLLQLRRALPSMERGQQTILMRTVLDLIAVALGRQGVVELPASSGAKVSERDIEQLARREIELRLGLPSLSTVSLCQRLGISRSKLFRLFKDEGGVQSYIRARRLDKVRDALAEPLRRESVSDLAYRFGFSDTSHLTRLFKAAYGETPTAFRAANTGPGSATTPTGRRG